MVENMFKEYPEVEVTYINKITNEAWPKWKKYKECEPKERLLINLRQIFPNEILLDLEEVSQLENVKKKLDEMKMNYLVYKTGSRGYHIHLFFNNIAFLSKERRNEIRKIFIKMFGADETKASENTLIAIEGRPHFKTMNEKILIEEKPGENVLDSNIIQEAIKRLDNFKEKKLAPDVLFNDYHKNDPFFNYVKTHPIPDSMGRNNIVFPNIAIGLVKEGLNEQQIEEVMKPIIQTNFPGKTYAEFRGWVKKALTGEIDTYNTIQLNKWFQNLTNKDVHIYDTQNQQVDILTSSLIWCEEVKDEKNLESGERRRFFADSELSKVKDAKTEWLIENWIPKGDICFIVGKAASFKTTITLHMSYALSTGKLAFNVYPTKKSKVLYLNEENSNNIFLNMISRVKKGLDITESDPNIFFSLMENFRLDKIDDLQQIIKYIKENNIEVLVCDSFRRFIGFDENKATEMSLLFNNLKVLRKTCNNLTIIILHHLKKDNPQNQGDPRDAIRGSSDILNSVDSAIYLKRKIGQNSILIEHIKTRAMQESLGKILIMDSGENKDKAYIYESSSVVDKSKVLSAVDMCANEIVKFLEDKKLVTFSRNDLDAFKEKYSYDTLTKAIRILKDEGTLIQNTSGKYSNYTFNSHQTQLE